jgi:hypothetical protein
LAVPQEQPFQARTLRAGLDLTATAAPAIRPSNQVLLQLGLRLVKLILNRCG